MLEYLLSRNLIPTTLIKLGIFLQLNQRIAKERRAFRQSKGTNKLAFIDQLKQSQIALSTQTANQQHYEVPTEFFEMVLGPRLKYSCCSWQHANNLAEAENEMLTLYCQRADLKDGQSILDLGCGWGSLSLFLAEKYPNSQITALSNSMPQTLFIQKKANEKGLLNIETVTQDVNFLNLQKQFDRILSIEMFEHIRNYQQLLAYIANLLTPSGKLFVHHFCHRQFVYPYQAETSWMAKHFFQDGLMPSEDLLTFFQQDLCVEKQWRVSGMDYSKTSQAWLDRLLGHKKEIITLFRAKDSHNAEQYYQYWRLFFLACHQFFAFNQGGEWFVTHYLFKQCS